MENTEVGQRQMSQREKMKALYKQHKGDEKLAVKQYAQAEKDGEVKRDSNEYDLSPENYAQRLWNDGVNDGWLMR